jgi:D-sedoheptulose 7-phosphate isomerase
MCVAAETTATVQELHLVALHLVCESFDEALIDDERNASIRASAGRVDR